MKNKKLLAAVCLSLSSMIGTSQVVINELQPVNETTIQNEFGDYVDWLELYNNSSNTVDLSGIFLSDDFGAPFKWEFPQGTTIAAGEFLLIYADEIESGLHTSFKLSGSGEELGIFDEEGQTIDSVTFPAIPANASYGRITDGSGDFEILASPTPEQANNPASIQGIAEPASFSLAGGFYANNQTLELSTDLSGAVIRYTIDGSDPIATSPIYSGPITIEKDIRQTQKIDIQQYGWPTSLEPNPINWETGEPYYRGNREYAMVVKARVFHDDYFPSKTTGATYFIDMRQPSLPVISLSTNHEHLFSDESGIYIQGTNGATEYFGDYFLTANWLNDWERPAYFEYYDEEGQQQVQKKVGISVMGAVSRNWDQKSLNVKTKSEYESGRLRYPFFSDFDNDSFDALSLRNSGNDWDIGNMARDAIIQNIVKGQMEIDYQEYEPAVLYINGEYFGLQNIRERLNSAYCADHHSKVDKDEIDLIKVDDEAENFYYAAEGDDVLFFEMAEYLNSQNFSDDDTYNHFINTYIDVNEIINYYIAEIYCGNGDWPHNNIRIWRPKTETGKFRAILFDTDFGYGLWGGDAYTDHLTPNITTGWQARPEASTLLLRKLLENDNFKNEFAQRFAYHINTTYSAARLRTIANAIENRIANERDRYSDNEWTRYCDFGFSVNAMIDWGTERPNAVRNHINSNFGNQNWSSLTVRINADQGNVFLCSQKINGNYTGQHLRNTPIRLKAVPADGYMFSHWEDASGNVLSEDTEYFAIITATSTVEAVFTERPLVSGIVINEYMTSNRSWITDESGETADWIEIYNTTSSAIDLAGLYIATRDDSAANYRIPYGDSLQTIIAPGEFKILWADNDPEEGAHHLDLRLGQNDSILELRQIMANGSIETISSIVFHEIEQDHSLGCHPDASSDYYLFSEPTPGATNENSSPIITAIDEVSNNTTPTKAIVFPNPNRGVFNIVIFDSSDLENKISIKNTLGICVYTETIYTHSDRAQINVSHLEKGVYLVQIENTNGISTQRIIIE